MVGGIYPLKGECLLIPVSVYLPLERVWFSVVKMFLAEIYMIPITVYTTFMMPNRNSNQNHENKEYWISIRSWNLV